MVATMSRSRTPTISSGASRPETATTPKADAMKSLSATGSITLPSADAPNRRARGPSSRSVVAAIARMTIRHAVETSGKATASGMRTTLSRSAVVQRSRP